MRIFLALIFISSSLLAQNKRGDVWVLGRSTSATSKLVELGFRGDTVSMNTFLSDDLGDSMADPSLSTICDTNGDLLLYSNGCSIYNRNHEIIENGDSLVDMYDLFGLCRFGFTGNSEGVVFTHHPCDSNLVHLIYLDQLDEDFELLSRKLMRTTVDVSDPQRPFVTDKNGVIHEDIYDTGAIFVTSHSNGLDSWICLLELESNCYNCFLLSEDGFSEPVISCTGPLWGKPSEQSLGGGVGPGDFSPDGRTYVRFNFEYGLNIYDFDNSTGELIHKEQIFLKEDDFLGHVGASISPNSRYLYASAEFRLYQFDLYADTIENSGQIVDTLDFNLPNNHRFRISRLAPNGKIYIAGFNSPVGLHVVHKPNLEGKACQVEQLGLKFPEGVVSLSGLPNNPWYGDLPDLSLCDSMVSVIDPILETQNLQVFPNPVGTTLHIELDIIEAVPYEIHDVSGRKVDSGVLSSRTTEIDLLDLTAGIYFIEIYSGGKKTIRRFVKH